MLCDKIFKIWNFKDEPESTLCKDDENESEMYKSWMEMVLKNRTKMNVFLQMCFDIFKSVIVVFVALLSFSFVFKSYKTFNFHHPKWMKSIWKKANSRRWKRFGWSNHCYQFSNLVSNCCLESVFFFRHLLNSSNTSRKREREYHWKLGT